MSREINTLPAPTRLITHWGGFHADDVMAASVLRRIFPGAEIVRTRNSDILDNTTDRDIVFDVGFLFDPEKRRYDHHQPCAPKRDNLIPYSSFGLVWKYHGMEYLRTILKYDKQNVLDIVWSKLDEGLVSEVDAGDNGYIIPNKDVSKSKTTLFYMIDDMNPTWDDPEQNPDGRFIEAVETFGPMLERQVLRQASLARAHVPVLEAFRNSDDPRIVRIPDYMPTGSIVYDYGFDEALYLVEHSRTGDWYVTCVRPKNEPFSQRKSFPQEWAGLRDADLAAVTGVADAIFCHTAKFICAAKSEEGALHLAQIAADWRLTPSSSIHNAL